MLRELIRIQRSFLWSGIAEGNKVAWVKWDVVCQPKDKGGLGVKNLELFNLSLLAKWRWRILTGTADVWLCLLKARYGDLRQRMARAHVDQRASIWWRDLCLLEAGPAEQNGWFSNAVKMRLKMGNEVRFWTDVSVGSTTLQELFPRLYSGSAHKGSKVSHMGVWEQDSWRWILTWSRILFQWEEAELGYLNQQHFPIQPSRECLDHWIWCEDASLLFSV